MTHDMVFYPFPTCVACNAFNYDKPTFTNLHFNSSKVPDVFGSPITFYFCKFIIVFITSFTGTLPNTKQTSTKTKHHFQSILTDNFTHIGSVCNDIAVNAICELSIFHLLFPYFHKLSFNYFDI